MHILGILHHVFHTLHLGAHLLNGLTGGDEGGGRVHKGGEEGLEGHNHAQGELTLHGEKHTENQHHKVCQCGEENRHHAEIGVEHGKFDRLCVDRGLITRPAGKKAVFGAAGLDGLHHLNSRNRGGCQLARIPHLNTGDVDAFFGDQVAEKGVDDDGGDAHHGEHNTVAEHDSEI